MRGAGFFSAAVNRDEKAKSPSFAHCCGAWSLDLDSNSESLGVGGDVLTCTPNLFCLFVTFFFDFVTIGIEDLS